MDPCPFVRILIRNLALKFPVASKPALSAIHPTSSPCFCRIKLHNFPTQIVSIPLISQDDCDHIPSSSINACFNLNKSQFDQLVNKLSNRSTKKPANCLKIEIYTGRRGYICGFNSGKLLGTVRVPLNLKGAESKSCVIQNGWVLINDSSKESSAKLNLNVKTEPDPRFVFQFDGEPECSPQVFQVNGHLRQPVFTCNFSFRNSGDRNLRSRSSLSEESKSPLSWLNLLKSDQDQPIKERKGWSITIHDLSGSPVAAASMVTPFVPSPGTDRVSRANPGAWLILHAGDGTWKPWGRLEAWRERGGGEDHLGYRFELLPGGATAGMDAVTIADSNLSIRTGGKFAIDMSNVGITTSSPMYSPSSSFDFGSGSGSGSGSISISDVGSGSWAHVPYRGFVMSSTVGRSSNPEVEVGVQHVTCTEDAAAFVAVAAAIDLSVDACRLFSQKLQKELRQ